MADLPSLCQQQRSLLLCFLRLMTRPCTRPPSRTNIPIPLFPWQLPHLFPQHLPAVRETHGDVTLTDEVKERKRERRTGDTKVDNKLYFFFLKRPAGEISEKHKRNTWTFHILLCWFLHQELCMSWNDYIFLWQPNIKKCSSYSLLLNYELY